MDPKMNDQIIRLAPTFLDDSPELARIHVVACASDNAIGLYFPGDVDFESRVAEMLRGQIGNPAWVHTKAIDDKTGNIAAWASWCTTTYEPIQAPSDSERPPQQDAQKKGEFKFRPGLAAFVRDDADRLFGSWAGDRQHIKFRALLTEQRYRHRGIGAALVVQAISMAQDKSLPMICQATPFGYPLYAADGFRTIGQLDVDLREWAPGAQGNDRGYGNYRYRYMLRMSESLAESQKTGE